MLKGEVGDTYHVGMLQAQLQGLGYHFHYTPETPTTMTLAQEHILAKGILPAVFLTDHQTRGVGSKKDRVWMDDMYKSIMFSAALRADPADLAKLQDMLALKAALAVKETTGIEGLKLKWPNDFVIDDKKAGGMLVPAVYEETADGLAYLGSNLGLGLNVHYTQEDVDRLSPLTAYGMTSLDLHTPIPNNRQNILVAMLSAIKYVPLEASWIDKNIQDTQDLNNKWRLLAAILGRNIQVEFTGAKPRVGKVLDTQIGKGVLLEAKSGQSNWINSAGLERVRILE